MLMNSGGAITGDLFHTPTGVAFADLTINGERRTWPIRSNTFRAWLRRSHYEATGTALDVATLRSTLDLLGAARYSMRLSAQFTSGSPNMPATSTSILPMTAGARSKSGRMDGG